MNDHIQSLLEQIRSLQDELRTALHEQEARVRYQIKGKRVEFEQAVRETHRRFKVGLFEWLRTSRPQSFLSAPFIYGMIVPIVIFDLSMTLYQQICFRLYGIPRVIRRDYVVIDRHQLAYLNIIEKFNCVYCSYGNGVVSYAREITARTEQYWCPIKHARKVADSHERYQQFLPYGDGENYPEKLEAYRKALADEVRDNTQ